MFDNFPTYLANQRYGVSPVDTPAFMGGWQAPASSVAVPDLTAGNMAPMAMPTIPMMDSVSAQQPGLFDRIVSSVGDWFHNTPFTTTLDTKNGMKTQGMFDMGLGAAQGLLGAYLGFQNLGIAKDTLNQNKRAFDLNFNAQRNLTNSRLADRQAARVAANPTAYASVADYMKTNGI